MDTHKVKLYQRIKRTPTVESFRFIPEERIDFLPGQFLKVIFDEQNIANPELNKYLSFSCSPTKNYIEVTKRISDSQFSQKLKGLQLDDSVLIQAPLGKSVFREDYRDIGFLIGGIGITPVVSIIEYIMDKKLNTRVTLIYSNRSEEEIAFREKLDLWLSKNSNLKVIYVLSETKSDDPNILSGRIDKNLISIRFPDISERVVFIFGPPKMVEAMNNLCLELSLNKANIITENFVGY